MEINPATRISLCTVRLESLGARSSSVGTGYCYCFNFLNQADGNMALVAAVVTNKHVVEGATRVRTEFQIIKQGSVIKEDAQAEGEERLLVEFSDLDFEVVRHPDPDVDLCIILLGRTLNSIKEGYGVKTYL